MRVGIHLHSNDIPEVKTINTSLWVEVGNDLDIFISFPDIAEKLGKDLIKAATTLREFLEGARKNEGK